MEPRFVLDDIAATSKPDELLRSYQPQHEQFKRLRALYAKLLAESQSAPQEKMPDTGPYLVAGIKHADIISMRRRLKVAAEKDEDVYDTDLSKQSRRFKTRLT